VVKHHLLDAKSIGFAC